MPLEGTFDRLNAIQGAFRPEDRPGRKALVEETGSASSFISGGGMTNDIAIGTRVTREITRDRGDYDPDFKPGTFLRDNKEYTWLLDMAADDDDLFDALHGSHNETDLVALADNTRDRMEAAQEMWANPVSGVTGMVAGMLTSPTSLLPLGAGFKALRFADKLVTSAQTARAVAASKIAVGEAGINAAIQSVENVSDPAAGAAEIGQAALFGAGVGGAIGSVAPRLGVANVGPFVDPKQFDRSSVVSPPAATGEPQGRPVGAAATPIDDPSLRIPTPETAASFGHEVQGIEFFRSIKQRALNWTAQTTPKTQKSVNAYTDLLGKFVRFDQPTRGEELGVTTRALSVEEFKEVELRQAMKGTMDAEVRGAWTKFVSEFPETQRWQRHRIVRQPDSARFGFQDLIPKKQITRAEFDFLQVKVARLMEAGAEKDLATDTAIRQHIGPELDLKQSKGLAEAVGSAVTSRSTFFDSMRDMAIEAGLDDDGKLAIAKAQGKPYIPQVYDVTKVLAREDEVAEAVMENMRWNPPQEWLDAIADNADLEDLELEGLVKGGDFTDLPEETKDTLRAMLTTELSDRADAKIDARVETARKALGAKRDEGIEFVMQKHEIKIAEQREKVAETTQLLARKQAGEPRIRMSQKAILERLAKQETKLNDLTDKKDIAKRAMSDAAKWQDMVRSAARGTGLKVQKTARKLVEDAAKAEAKVAKAEGKAAKRTEVPELAPIARKMVKNINSSLTRGDSAHGFNMGDVPPAGQTGRLHPRQIDWGVSLRRGDELVDDILINDMDQLVESYIEQVGTRIGMQRALGTAEPKELIEDIVKELPNNLRENAAKDMEAIVDRSLGRHHLKGMGSSQGGRFTTQVLKNWNVATMLGSSTFSLAGDLGMMTVAREASKGAVGALFKGMFRAGTRRAKTITDNLIAMDRNTLAALTMGARNLSNVSSRQAKLMDIDALAQNHGVGIPGTMMWKATRLAMTASRGASDAMMTANLMNAWNVRWDTVLRQSQMTFVTDLSRKGWDNVDPQLQAVMRGAGLTPAKLAKFKDLPTVKVQDVTLPDIDNWPKESALDMIRWVQTRSMNGIIAPGIGDSPRFVNDPLGSLMFQFQGFPFAAQQKMVRRAQQMGGIRNTLVQQALLISLMAGGLSQLARQASQGKELPNLEDPRTMTQFIYDVALRSPFAVAALGTFAELGINQAGRPSNAVLESLGLPSVIPQNSRLRERNGLEIILGPGASTANNLMTGTTEAAAQLATGEPGDAGKRLGKLMPFSSHFAVRTLGALLGDE